MASNFSRVKILAIFQLLHTTWCFRFFLEFHNLMLDYLMTLKNLNKNAKNLLLFMRKLEVIKNYDGWEFERCKATKKLTNFSIIYGKCYYYDKVNFTYATYARNLKLDHIHSAWKSQNYSNLMYKITSEFSCPNYIILTSRYETCFASF